MRLEISPGSWDTAFTGEDSEALWTRTQLSKDSEHWRGVIYLDPKEHTVEFGVEAIRAGSGASTEIGNASPERTSSLGKYVRRGVDDALFGARAKMENIRYLGPARIAGQRIYPLDESGRDYVGPKGERLAEMLFRLPDPLPAVDRREAVNAYLRQMDTGYQVVVPELAGLGSAVEVMMVDYRPNGVVVGIPDVGFGISQLLPILTEIAAMSGNPKRSDILLIEQPELHLNPRWQQSFARLLAEPLRHRSESNDALNQVIIETHGTHLVDEVAKLVSDRQIDAEAVCVLMGKVNPRDGRLQFQRLPIRPDMSRYVCEDY